MDYLSLCLICKDENDYLSEWLDYHILMGVDRFYIYDNESQVSLRETLKDYIERGWVVVIDIPGKAVQLHAYDHCLRTFGVNTFWLGFIDTDEFLVPKTTLDLKELLRDYEAFGGLAVSSMFFGSGGIRERPAGGQIASYTLRTHETSSINLLLKSIVQPCRVDLPYSPHDFTFKENSWCVNEDFLRVDNQEFPNHIEKIQLNHYFCRSASEVELKILRGRGDAGEPWLRKRFDDVNSMATYVDKRIIQNLDALFQDTSFSSPDNLDIHHNTGLLDKMVSLACRLQPNNLVYAPAGDVIFRAEISTFLETDAKFFKVKQQGDYEEIKRWILKIIPISPQRAILYTDLAICYLNLGDPLNAWQVLVQGWQLAPNSYSILYGMAFYFVRVKNFIMVEKTCYLLLEMAPHDLAVLGFLTDAMIGQERWNEALKIGVPVLELAATIGTELPEQMGIFLVKKMAGHLQAKKDYAGAAHLWEIYVKFQPGDVSVLLELSQVLMLAGDQNGALQRLSQARELDPQNETVLAQIKQLGPSVRPPSSVPGRIIRRH